MYCGCKLRDQGTKKVACHVIGSEGVQKAFAAAKRCQGRKCGTVYRVNFAWSENTKVNSVTLADVQKSGVYFVHNYLAFSLPYLQMTRDSVYFAGDWPPARRWTCCVCSTKRWGMT